MLGDLRGEKIFAETPPPLSLREKKQCTPHGISGRTRTDVGLWELDAAGPGVERKSGYAEFCTPRTDGGDRFETVASRPFVGLGVRPAAGRGRADSRTGVNSSKASLGLGRGA